MSDHPCADHYRVSAPDYWCEVCQAFRKPDEPLIVRLARVAHPDGNWQDMEVDPPEAMDWQDQVVRRSRYFTLDDLNDLALVERRVIEAGFGTELTARILAWTEWPEDHQPTREGELLAAFTAPAPQRAAALDALFTAFPDLYERLTGSQ